jgi:hypothetical protein
MFEHAPVDAEATITAAVWLSEQAGWNECVTTTIDLSGRTYTIAAGKDRRGPLVTIEGAIGSSVRTLVDWTRFNDRLREAQDGLPETVRARTENLLTSSETAAPAAAGRSRSGGKKTATKRGEASSDGGGATGKTKSASRPNSPTAEEPPT